MYSADNIYDDLRQFETSRWDVSPADVQKFQSTLASARSERPIQLFLQEHPQLLCAYLRSGHGEWVIPQKRLGAEFVPDFVVGCGNSGGNFWEFIELESPAASLVLRNGQPSKELRTAVHQIESWRKWLQNNLDYARRSVSENGLGLYDVSPLTHSKIVIGRRSAVTPAFNTLRSMYRERNHIEVVTYDRLIEDFSWISGIIRQNKESTLALIGPN